MEVNCSNIAYQDTGFFSKIAIDYLNNAKELQPFLLHQPNLQGIQQAITARKNFATNRQLLVQELTKQYQNISLTQLQEKNLQALLQENTFTITTAHQPNIFTGPLYFIYKILHVIKLVEACNQHFTNNHFVPVYYMGSEDADLDELGFINIDGKKLVWQTTQTGAVGRMKVDKNLLHLIDEMYGQIGVQKFGNDFIQKIKSCYTEGKTIQQATLEFVNTLFNQYGLLIIIADTTAFKQCFETVINKELQENFSNKKLQQTVSDLGKHYKVQTVGRAINLFYLQEQRRDRIEKENNQFFIKSADGTIETLAIEDAIKNNIQAFSPNVVLRGVFQETILPNVAFVGGGGELAYWLELKDIFNAVQVPYPVLFLRNSFLVIEQTSSKLIDKLKIPVQQLFLTSEHLVNEQVKQQIATSFKTEVDNLITQIDNAYSNIQQTIVNNYPTIAQHTEALQTKNLKQLQALHKKIIRAEKRKQTELVQQINTLKHQLFPKENLQERTENIALFYAKYGDAFINILYKHTLTTEQKFTILKLKV